MAYSNGYSYRRLVTIDHTKVIGSSNFTDFAFPIIETQVYLKSVSNGGKVTSESGNDIRFENSSDAKLDHELVSYDPATGAVQIFVEASTLLAASATEIWMYYGKSGASAEQNKNGTWNSNFAAVYHCEEASGAQLLDSTANNNHSSTHTFTSSSAATMLGKGREGDGTKIISIPDSASLNFTQLTVEAIIDLDSAAEKGILAKGIHDTTMEYNLNITSTGKASFGVDDNGAWGPRANLASSSGISTATRYRLVGVFTGSVAKLYVNGTEVASVSDTFTPLNSSGNLYIGSFFDTSSYLMDGRIDEIRIHNTGRSVDWVQTNDNAISSPGTFYSIGSEEVAVITETITKSLQYAVRTTTAITKSGQYAIKYPVSLTKSAQYAIYRTIAAITKGLEYVVAPQNVILRSLQYAILTMTGIQKDMAYKIIADNAITKQFAYAILTDTQLQKGMIYSIISIHSLTKAMQYVIYSSGHITKGMTYEIGRNGYIYQYSPRGTVYERYEYDK